MNFGITILLVVSGWSLLSIAVSVALGATAKGRDAAAVTQRPEPAVRASRNLAS